VSDVTAGKLRQGADPIDQETITGHADRHSTKDFSLYRTQTNKATSNMKAPPNEGE
jgi:hypothetical protein